MQVSVWSMHLAYKSYGPYAAQNKQVTSEAQVSCKEDQLLSISN